MKIRFFVLLNLFLCYAAIGQNAKTVWSQPLRVENKSGFFIGNPIAFIGENENYLFIRCAIDLKEQKFVLRKMDKKTMARVAEIPDIKGSSSIVFNNNILHIFIERKEENKPVYYVRKYSDNLDFLEEIKIVGQEKLQSCLEQDESKEFIKKNKLSPDQLPSVSLNYFWYDEKTQQYIGMGFCNTIWMNDKFEITANVDKTLVESLGTKLSVITNEKEVVSYGSYGIKKNGVVKPLTITPREGEEIHSTVIHSSDKKNITEAILYSDKPFNPANTLVITRHTITGETYLDVSIPLNKKKLPGYKTSNHIFSFSENQDGTIAIYLVSMRLCMSTESSGYFGSMYYIKISSTGEVLSTAELPYYNDLLYIYNTLPQKVEVGEQNMLHFNAVSRSEFNLSGKENPVGIYNTDNTTGKLVDKQYILLQGDERIISEFVSQITDKRYLIISRDKYNWKEFRIGYLTLP